MPHPYIVCNYKQTIDAVLLTAEQMLKALKDIKTESCKALKAKIEGIIKQLTELSRYVTAMVAHIVVLENAPHIIVDFRNDLKTYLEKIENSEIDEHRKQLLPILAVMQQQSITLVIDPSESLSTPTKVGINFGNFYELCYSLSNCLIKLTERQTTDDVCLFTQEPIPPHRAIHFHNGHKFDFLELLTYQYSRLLRTGETAEDIQYLNPLTNEPFTPVDLVCIRRFAVILKIKLSKNRELLWQSCDEYRAREALDECCNKSDLSEIKKLLFNSQGVIKNNLLAFRALGNAVRKNNINVAKFLLELGVSPNFPSKENPDEYYPPLIIAVMDNNIAMAELLLKYKAEVDALSPHTIIYRSNALSIAVSNGEDNDVMVKMLLTAGVDVNQRYLHRTSYESPVFKAVNMGNFKIVTMLIEAGAIIHDDQAILHKAVCSGKLEIVRLLVKHNVRLFNKIACYDEGVAITPLELARQLKFPEIIAFLEAAEKPTGALATTSQDVITERQIEYAIHTARNYTATVDKERPVLCLNLIAQRFSGTLSRERDETMVNSLKEYAQKQLRSIRYKPHDHPLFAIVSFLNVIQENLKLLPATTTITQPIMESTASLLSSSLFSSDGILKSTPPLTTDENHQKKESESVVHSLSL